MYHTTGITCPFVPELFSTFFTFFIPAPYLQPSGIFRDILSPLSCRCCHVRCACAFLRSRVSRATCQRAIGTRLARPSAARRPDRGVPFCGPQRVHCVHIGVCGVCSAARAMRRVLCARCGAGRAGPGRSLLLPRGPRSPQRPDPLRQRAGSSLADPAAAHRAQFLHLSAEMIALQARRAQCDIINCHTPSRLD